MERFLLSHGGLWSEPGKSPALINGPFDQEPVIEKKVKAAAKFVSAEEEALGRKAELFQLKRVPGASNDGETPALPSDATKDAVSSVTEEKSAVESLCSNSVSNVIDEYKQNLSKDSQASEMVTPLKPSTARKQSILSSTNPDLLNTLNKMFNNMQSPVAGLTLSKTPFRRASTASMVTQSTASDSSDSLSAATQNKIAKETKSKLLKVNFSYISYVYVVCLTDDVSINL